MDSTGARSSYEDIYACAVRKRRSMTSFTALQNYVILLTAETFWMNEWKNTLSDMSNENSTHISHLDLAQLFLFDLLTPTSSA